MSKFDSEGETFMSKSLTLEENPKQEIIQCPNQKCTRTFTKPLLATLKTEKGKQTYYACPYCLTEITKQTRQKKTEKQEKTKTLKSTEKGKSRNVKSEAKGNGCSHYLGYLKKRPKNSPIPDECLSCPQMVECLLK